MSSLLRVRLLRTLQLVRCVGLAAICVSSVTIATAVNAEPASVKLLTAPLITPPSAWSFYGSSTTHTTGSVGWTSANRPAEIKELARSLSRNGSVSGDAYATVVDQYVRNNIEIEFRFGLSKGARGALIDQSGTAFDQVHLMIELLREGGAAANYQVGTITLNATQFYDWSGLLDAKASCQYLADGGIPATVNSATSCAALTGNLTTATLGHIWVSTGGKLYDPAYKRHLFKASIDLASALGCGTSSVPTCGTTIAALIPFPTLLSGTTNVYKIQNVPEASVNAQLRNYAVNLQGWIQSYNANNKTSLSLDDVIGGKLIDTSAVFSPGSSLPYGFSVQYSWSGDIPDQYRTTLRAQFDAIDQTMFVDELAGKRLRIWGQGAVDTTASYSRTAALYVEYKPIAKSTKANATPTDGILTLTADHPYAANSGTYMDETVQRATTFGIGFYFPGGGGGGCCWINTMTILNGWGESTRSTVQHFGALQSRDLNSTAAEDVSSSNHYWFYKPSQISAPVPCSPATASATPAPDPGCYEQHQPTSAATWLAQASNVEDMVARLVGARVQSHHSLGWVLSGEQIPVSVLNVETSLSAVSETSTAGARQAAFFGISAAINRLEGSVFEQQFDSWDGGSGISYLVKSNAKGTAALWIDSANIGTALTKLTNYSAARKASIQSYATSGYLQIIPQNGYLGVYSYSSGNTLTINTNATAAYAIAGDRIGYLVDGRFKGASAGSAIRPFEATLNSIKVMDYSLKSKKYFGVDLASGDLSISPSPDIVAGVGAFPISLPYQRFYSSSAQLEALDGSNNSSGGARDYLDWIPRNQTVSELGGGWSHNYDVSAKMASDGFKGLGIDAALDASASIAALFTTALLNDGALTFGSHLATVFATNWWISRLQNNVVVLRQPPKAKVFTRLADDSSFDAEPGSADVLVQSGNRVFKIWLDGYGSGFNYDGVRFSLTDRDGTLLNLSYPTTTIYNAPLAVPAQSVDSTGVKITYANSGSSNCVVFTWICLSGVANSLGRSLSLDPSDVADENGRHVYFKTTQAISSGNYPDPTKNNAMFWVPTKFIATGLDSKVTTYEYVANPMTAINRPYPRVYRWFTPSSAVTPYITTSYDGLFRAKKVTDNLSHATDYFISGIYGSENQKPAALRDPLGNVTTSLFDQRGQPTAVINPLGNTSTMVYDGARRLLRKVMPEGDAIEYQYDVRSNRTQECAIAKGRVNWSSLNPITEQSPQCNAGLGDLVKTISYVEGPTVWPCANPKSCNKPAYEIGPKGNRTDYSYCAPTNSDCPIDTGQLRKVTVGLNSGGSCAIGSICPITTYGYTAYTGSDSATFFLLTSKQERLDPTNAAVTRTTTWAYDPSNHWALKEQIIDSGGLSLQTCLKLDAIGNLISKTDPKAGLASCP